MRVLPLLLAASMVLTSCGMVESLTGTDDHSIPEDAVEHEGLVPVSREFDAPFDVSFDGGSGTVTLTAPRIVQNWVHDEAVVVVDVRVVQSAGEPLVVPEMFNAFDPAGAMFERAPGGTGNVNDPLVETRASSPGEEITGQVAWLVPRGERIGRVDVAAPGTLAMLTVVRQPEDPMASSS